MPLAMQEGLALLDLEALIINSSRVGIIAMQFINKLRANITDLLTLYDLLQLELLLTTGLGSFILGDQQRR